LPITSNVMAALKSLRRLASRPPEKPESLKGARTNA
jgi:hypothetical protein